MVPSLVNASLMFWLEIDYRALRYWHSEVYLVRVLDPCACAKNKALHYEKHGHLTPIPISSQWFIKIHIQSQCIAHAI